MEQMIRAASKQLGVEDVNNSVQIQEFFERSKKTEDDKRARNFLLTSIVESQLQQGDGQFYSLLMPWSTCTTCHGLGQKVEIKMEKVPVRCHFCEGTGIKTVICKSCHGDGTNPDGTKCKTCKGTGKYRYYGIEGRDQKPCPNCTPRKPCPSCNGEKGKKDCDQCHGSGRIYLETKGSGQVMAMTSARKINKTFFCGHCHGTGKAKEPTNPVMSAERAKVISDAVADSTAVAKLKKSAKKALSHQEK